MAIIISAQHSDYVHSLDILILSPNTKSIIIMRVSCYMNSKVHINEMIGVLGHDSDCKAKLGRDNLG